MAEIDDLYQSLFGRAADSGGASYWGSTGLTGDALKNAMVGAAQGSDRGAVVNNSYSDLFGRQAETGGSNFWTSDDSWNKYASGGLDKLNLQIGGGSRDSDEFALMKNLASDKGSTWSKTFYDPTNAEAVWKALLDEDGFNLNSLQKPLAKVNPTLSGTSSAGYKDYLNPYLDEVLNSAVRKIGEQGDIARNRLGTSAFSAGAYGDARHGVESDNLTQSLMEAIGDLTATTKAQGFESAMGWYNQDLNRQADTAYKNAMLQGDWYDRNLNSANTANNMDLNSYTQNANWLSFLQGMDNYDRNWTQQSNNANYEDFWARQNWDQNQLTSLLNFLNAMPGQTTSVNSQADNSTWNSLGTWLGSALGNSGGSGSSAGSGSFWSSLGFI